MLNSFQDTVQWLYGRLPMYQRVGASAYKKDLTNIRKLCDALGNPQDVYPTVHIAGTNGKGSTSSMIHSVLSAAGYRSGLYTSPHLKSFTERIRVGKENISEAAVVHFVNRYRALIEAVDPSFFELTAAMAFWYYAEQSVDIAVIEVGLGGRLDSTNIILPRLSVITNISWDHADLLGDTLAQIAGEKAGIIKPGIPVILGQYDEETGPVFKQKAAEMEAPIVFADQVYTGQLAGNDLFGQRIDVTHIRSGRVTRCELDLAGHYQRFNLCTVLTALRALHTQGWAIGPDAITEGLANVRSYAGLRGRMEVIQQQPLILADIAHNEAGIRESLAQLAGMDHRQLHILLGMVSDKDHDKILALFPAAARYYFARPDVPRGLDAAALRAKASQWGLQGEVYGSVQEALHAMKDVMGPEDLGYAGGSTFVVAEVV